MLPVCVFVCMSTKTVPATHTCSTYSFPYVKSHVFVFDFCLIILCSLPLSSFWFPATFQIVSLPISWLIPVILKLRFCLWEKIWCICLLRQSYFPNAMISSFTHFPANNLIFFFYGLNFHCVYVSHILPPIFGIQGIPLLGENCGIAVYFHCVYTHHICIHLFLNFNLGMRKIATITNHGCANISVL